eukprot:gene354-645_t
MSGQYPLSGVTIQYLKSLADLVQKRDPNMTTGEVNDKFILKWRGKENCSLTELFLKSYTDKSHPELLLKSSDAVQHKANVYVSHKWDSPFLDLFSCIENFHDVNTTIFQKTYWIDFCCINSILNSNNASQQFYFSQMKNIIASIGQTLLVIPSPMNPHELSDVKCLWDIACTPRSANFTVAILKPNQASFIEKLLNDPEYISGSILKKNISSCISSNNQEFTRKEKVMKRNPDSSDATDQHVKNHLIDWLRGIVEVQLEKVEARLGNKHVSYLQVVLCMATLDREQGRLQQAEQSVRHVLDLLTDMDRNPHMKKYATAQQLLVTILLLPSTSSLLSDKREEAEDIMKQVIRIRTRLLGKGHPDTLASIRLLAKLSSQCQEPISNENETHVSLSNTNTNRPITDDDDEDDEGEEVWLSERRQSPKNMVSISILTHLTPKHDIEKDKDSDRDVETSSSPSSRTNRTSSNLRENFNFNSSSTANLSKSKDVPSFHSMMELGKVLETSGKHKVAEQLYRELLQETENQFKCSQDDVIAVTSKLAMLLNNNEEVSGVGVERDGVGVGVQSYSEAEKYCKQVYLYKEVNCHPGSHEMFVWTQNFASILKKQGKVTEVEALYRKFLSSREMGMGMDIDRGRGRGRGRGSRQQQHYHDTLTVVNDLVAILRTLKKFVEVEALYRRVLHDQDQDTNENVSPVVHSDNVSDMSNVNHIEDVRLMLLRMRNDFGSVLCDMGRIDEAEREYRRVASETEKLMGSTHSDSLAAHTTHAIILYEMDQYEESETLFERIVDIQVDELGSRHIDTLTSQSHLGDIYLMTNRPMDAENIYRRVVRGLLRTLGPDHIQSLDAQFHLAHTLFILKKYPEAEKLYRTILEKREMELGENHLMTIRTVVSLGNLLMEEHSFQEADILFKRALTVYVNALGENHKETLDIKLNIADLLMKQEKLDEAEQLYDEVLHTRQNILGTKNRDTLIAMGKLAGLYYVRKRRIAAESLYRKVVGGNTSVLGANHVDTLSSLMNLANLLAERKERGGDAHVEETESIYRKVLTARMRVLGQNHSDTIDTQTRLAALLDSQGKEQESEDLRNESLSVRQKWTSAQRRQSVTDPSSKQRLPTKEDQFMDEERRLRNRVEDKENNNGSWHLETLSAINKLGLFLWDNNDKHNDNDQLTEAETLLRRVVKGREKLSGPDHPDTLASMSYLAGILKAQGKYRDAEGYYKKVMKLRKDVLGLCHLDTLNSMCNTAIILTKLNKREDAEELYRRALKIYERKYGIKDPDTVSCLNRLALLLHDLGRYVEARELYVKALDGCKRAGRSDGRAAANTSYNLGCLYESMSDWCNAVDAFNAAHIAYTHTFGAQHEQTQDSFHRLEEAMMNRKLQNRREKDATVAGSSRSASPMSPARSRSRSGSGSRSRRNSLGPDAYSAPVAAMEGGGKDVIVEPDSITDIVVYTGYFHDRSKTQSSPKKFLFF